MADDLFEILRQAFSQIAAETVQLLPKVFLALIIIAVIFLAAKVLNYGFRQVFKLTKLDVWFKRLTGFGLPFTIDGLILFLADLGLALTAIYAIAHLFLDPQYLAVMNEGLYYGARIISIVIVSIVLIAIFNLIINRVRVETRLRSYAMLIVLLLVTAMLIDLTALSEHVKQALTTGLSLGVGISIGIFAFWFFFHEYFDQFLKNKLSKPKENQA